MSLAKFHRRTAKTVLHLVCASTVVAAGITYFASTSAPAEAGITNKDTQVLTLVNDYLNSLSTTQKSLTLVSNTSTNAAKWSNLPASPGTNGSTTLRNGVSFSSLTSAQQAAWTNLVKYVLGSEGYEHMVQIRRADDYLKTLAGGYSGDYQYLAIVGTPSTSNHWMIQVGGHHNAHNYYYYGTKLMTCTPYHIAVEPTSFTLNGATYAPMLGQRTAIFNMINSLTSTQLTSAKLSSSFSDIALGPGKDARSNFPTGTTGRGILGSSLTTTQQTLVKAAINAWVKDCPYASAYQTLYENELNSTYVAYSGTAALTAQGDYVRIDGPHVWIEFACQGGIVVQGQIHFHTIWRDRLTDYSADYTAFGFTSGTITN